MNNTDIVQMNYSSLEETSFQLQIPSVHLINIYTDNYDRMTTANAAVNTFAGLALSLIIHSQA